MQVTNDVKAYAVNGQSTKVGDKTIVRVTNHWNFKHKVCIQLIDADCASDTITVLASDLKRAIENSCNHKDCL